MKTYRCPKCKVQLEHVRYELEITESGDFCLDDYQYDDDDRYTNKTRYYCSECDARLIVRKVEDIANYNNSNS